MSEERVIGTMDTPIGGVDLVEEIKPKPRKRSTKVSTTATKPKRVLKRKPKSNAKVTKTAKAKKTTKKPVKKAKAKKPQQKIDKISDLDIRKQLILYVMEKMSKEVTYSELSLKIGITKGVLRDKLVAEKDPNNLNSLGLVSVEDHEPQNGAPTSEIRYFSLTEAGKKLLK